ncbi:unnamed protein product, partial [Allacma fusca]
WLVGFLFRDESSEGCHRSKPAYRNRNYLKAMVGILSSRVMGQVTNMCQEKKPDAKAFSARNRASERLRQRKKRSDLANHRKSLVLQPQQPAVELSLFPIQHGNPSHKILFLTRLGLIPQSQKLLPPFIKLHRLTSQQTNQSKRSSDNLVKDESPILETPLESPTSETTTIEIDSDDDLDLELVVTPIDIPEIFEEVFKKKPKMQLSANPSSNDLCVSIVTPKLSSRYDDSQLAKPNNVSIPHPADQWIAPNTLKASVHFIKHERGSVVPGRKTQINIPFVDLTMEEEENKDNLDALREKLLGYDTVLEFAD